MNPTQYFIGIDGGGTKCKARLESASGQLLSEAVAGPANAARNLAQSVTSIKEVCVKVFEKANLPLEGLTQTDVGLGLAGLNIPSVKKEFDNVDFPFKSWVSTTDLNIACLGAHNGEDGAVIILGTGSSAVVIKDGYELNIGGHGFLLGDQGSGAWIGKQAVIMSLLELDGFSAEKGLAQHVLQHYKCNNQSDLVSLLNKALPAKFATIAPTIIALSQDSLPQGKTIVNQATSYINNLVSKVASENPQRISIIGGLANALGPLLSDESQRLLSTSKLSPEEGAILFCKHHQHINEI